MQAAPAAKVERCWAPQAGSQQAFLEAPWHEVLYHGTRGPGKSAALLMAFAQHVGRFGRFWRGIIFREEAVQLADLVEKSLRMFPAIFPSARFISGGEHRKWVWPTGEELLFRHVRRVEDYQQYHGWEIPFLGWDELSNWASADVYLMMQSICRSSGPEEMPRIIRGTCNPYGVGRQWLKHRFIDPAPDRTPIRDEAGRIRMAIRGTIYENKILLKQDPQYLANLKADPDPARRKAWLEGDWNAVAGGIFDGKWSDELILEPFRIPPTWRVDRAFDWGSSAPYAAGIFAESDGTPAVLANGQERHFAKGSVFLIAEYYGWNGEPNKGIKDTNAEMARKIKQLAEEAGKSLLSGQEVQPGPADTSIFDVINGTSIADDMGRAGVRWTKAAKGPGSRVAGWQKLGEMMLAGQQHPMETPGFFVFSTCRQWIRTVPVLVRDRKKPDDVDTEQEDHMGDMTRYRVMKPKQTGAGVVQLPRVR